MKELTIAGLEHATNSRDPDQQEMCLEALEIALEASPDVLLAPEYFFRKGETEAYSRAEVDELNAKIATISNGRETLVFAGTTLWDDGHGLRNTCSIVRNGEVIREHHKQTMAGSDILYARRYGLNQENWPEKRAQYWKSPVISHKGFDIGLNICLDSIRPNFERYADIQAVISCNLGKLTDNLAAPLVVHCSGSPAEMTLVRDSDHIVGEIMKTTKIDAPYQIFRVQKYD